MFLVSEETEMSCVSTAEVVSDCFRNVTLVDRAELCLLRFEGSSDTALVGCLCHVVEEIRRLGAIDKVGGEET